MVKNSSWVWTKAIANLTAVLKKSGAHQSEISMMEKKTINILLEVWKNLMAVRKWNTLYRDIFGDPKFLLPARLSREKLDRINHPLSDFLLQESHKGLLGANLTLLFPSFQIAMAAQGYGLPDVIPTYYAFVWMTPEFFNGLTQQSLHKELDSVLPLPSIITYPLIQGLATILVGGCARPTKYVKTVFPDGYQTLWENMVKQDRLNVTRDVQLLSIVRGEGRGRGGEGEYSSRKLSDDHQPRHHHHHHHHQQQQQEQQQYRRRAAHNTTHRRSKRTEAVQKGTQRGAGRGEGREDGQGVTVTYRVAGNGRKGKGGKGGEKEYTEIFDALLYTAPLAAASKFITDLSDSESRIFNAIYNKTVLPTMLYRSPPVPGYSTSPPDYSLFYDAAVIKTGQEGKWQGDRHDCKMFGDGCNATIQTRAAYQYYGNGCASHADLCNVDRQAPFSPIQSVQDDLLQDFTNFGDWSRHVEVIEQFPWPYFPRFKQEGIQNGLPWDLIDLQGERRTLWLGGSACFESVLDITAYNLQMLQDKVSFVE